MNRWLERYRQLQREGQKGSGQPVPEGASSPVQDTPIENDPRSEESEVRWRREAMLSQVPSPPRAIGFLFARPDLADTWQELGRDHCHSCGDALPERYVVGMVPRCSWCQKAAELACNTVREGVRREQ